MAFDIAGDLGGKVGPFPTWVWIVVGGSAVGLVLYLRKKSQSSTSTTTSGTTPLTVNPYAFGGISSGGATFPSDAGGGVTPVPAVPPAQTVTPVQTPSPTPVSLPAPVGSEQWPAGVTQATGQPNAGLPLCQGHDSATCLVNLQPTQYGANIYFDPTIGAYSYSPSFGPAPTLATFGLSAPAQLPVGDEYGGIGMQTPAAAAAGGYWGQSGQWVATPTPWDPLPGQPPLGTLAPGTPYATGSAYGVTVPKTGAVVGAPVQYSR